jgi:polyphosphate kinase
MRESLEKLIQREIDHQRAGRQGRLIFKMNALVDGRIIRLLYQASQAGVKIDLLVRGMCCLRPGIPDVSENITVISIVGRFLEHSRIYYFRNGGAEEIYIGSADMMPRNLDRRVEALFPVDSERLRKRLKRDILDVYLSDNVKARLMLSSAAYVRRPRAKGERPVNAQEELISSEPGALTKRNRLELRAITRLER